MSKALNAEVVIFAVLWLIRGLHTAEISRASNHGDPDFYFNDSTDLSSKPASKTVDSNNPFQGRTIHRSAWSKEGKDLKPDSEESYAKSLYESLYPSDNSDPTKMKKFLQYFESLLHYFRENEGKSGSKLKDDQKFDGKSPSNNRSTSNVLSNSDSHPVDKLKFDISKSQFVVNGKKPELLGEEFIDDYINQPRENAAVGKNSQPLGAMSPVYNEKENGSKTPTYDSQQTIPSYDNVNTLVPFANVDTKSQNVPNNDMHEGMEVFSQNTNYESPPQNIILSDNKVIFPEQVQRVNNEPAILIQQGNGAQSYFQTAPVEYNPYAEPIMLNYQTNKNEEWANYDGEPQIYNTVVRYPAHTFPDRVFPFHLINKDNQLHGGIPEVENAFDEQVKQPQMDTLLKNDFNNPQYDMTLNGYDLNLNVAEKTSHFLNTEEKPTAYIGNPEKEATFDRISPRLPQEKNMFNEKSANTVEESKLFVKEKDPAGESIPISNMKQIYDKTSDNSPMSSNLPSTTSFNREIKETSEPVDIKNPSDKADIVLPQNVNNVNTVAPENQIKDSEVTLIQNQLNNPPSQKKFLKQQGQMVDAKTLLPPQIVNNESSSENQFKDAEKLLSPTEFTNTDRQPSYTGLNNSEVSSGTELNYSEGMSLQNDESEIDTPSNHEENNREMSPSQKLMPPYENPLTVESQTITNSNYDRKMHDDENFDDDSTTEDNCDNDDNGEGDNDVNSEDYNDNGEDNYDDNGEEDNGEDDNDEYDNDDTSEDDDDDDDNSEDDDDDDNGDEDYGEDDNDDNEKAFMFDYDENYENSNFDNDMDDDNSDEDDNLKNDTNDREFKFDNDDNDEDDNFEELCEDSDNEYDKDNEESPNAADNKIDIIENEEKQLSQNSSVDEMNEDLSTDKKLSAAELENIEEIAITELSKKEDLSTIKESRMTELPLNKKSSIIKAPIETELSENEELQMVQEPKSTELTINENLSVTEETELPITKESFTTEEPMTTELPKREKLSKDEESASAEIPANDKTQNNSAELHKPKETFNTILEYLYKHSNNSSFISRL